MRIGRSVASLFVRMGLDPSDFKRGAAETRAGVAGLRNELAAGAGAAGTLNKALGLLSSAGLLYAGRQAAVAAFELAELSARADATRANLEAFAGGSRQATAAMQAVIGAASGAINEMDAMTAASKLLQMGLATDTQSMDLYTQGAVRLGNQTQSASQRVDEMIQLLKNLNVNMLDNFGLSRSVITARTDELMATQGLTREEGMLLAIQEEITRQLGLLGDNSGSAAVKIDTLTASVDNLKLSWGRLVDEPVLDVVTELTGAIQNLTGASSLLDAAMQGNISWADAFKVALEAKVIASNEGVDASLRYIAASIEMGTAVERATGLHKDFNLELQATPGAVASAASAMGVFTSAADGWFSMYKSIAGKVPEPFREVWDIIETEQGRLRTGFIRDAVLKRDAEVTAARETEDAWKHAMATQEQSLEELRGIVQSALKPTAITAEDMGLADLGQYVDKWDENARRLQAIAERGFAEIDAHPDWAGMLKIPEGVLAGSEQALKAWARDQAAAVRDLERPDLINVDAAVQAVQDELNRRAAVELSLDLVTKAAIDRGLVTGEDAKDQVAAALGLSQALPVSLTVSDEEKEAFVAGLGTVPVAVTFSTGETEGMEAPGLAEMMDTAVQGISKGWEASLSEIPWMQTLSVAWLADIKASEGRLKEVGAAIGAPLWDGLLGRIRGSGIVNHIVAEVLAALVAETK